MIAYAMSIMLREIEEQPAVLERTYRRELGKARRFRARWPERKFRLVVLLARGTSDNAALFGRYLIEVSAGVPVSLAAPSVHTLYHSTLDLRDALAVGISQSGESADINIALQSCRKQGAYTLGITNEPRSTMVRLVDECWFVHAGKERSVAATKTYTGQLLALYLLCWALGGAIDLESVARLPGHAERVLKLRGPVESLVERYHFMRQAVVVGRGLNYANAYELALKLMETCYVATERFSSAEFLHGPIAMIDPGFPAFVFAPPGPTQPGIVDILKRLQAMGADTLGISCRPLEKLATVQLRIPVALDEIYTPIPYIIPGQMLAALLAESKGLDPDAPRRLSKITRTV
jgi:glucosamine--fructose-6-phosphate aminotransferase (isomerizing)